MGLKSVFGMFNAQFITNCIFTDFVLDVANIHYIKSICISCSDVAALYGMAFN